MHNFVAACTCLLAVCATALPSDVARKTDEQIKYRLSRSLVVPHWDRFNPIDNAPFDLNGPAADSQVDALPSAHWPYRARYPAAAAAPPNTFPVPFESIYRPVYAPTADAFRRLSTDEIELFEHLTAVRDLLRKLDDENAASRRDTVSSTVASSTYSSSTRSPENPIVQAADATLAAGEEREESVWPTADEPGEDPGKAFDEYKELYAMYLRRENAAEDGGAGLRETEAAAEVDADWTAATADAETAAAGGTSAPELDNGWAPAVADRQRMAEAQDGGGGGGDGNVYRYVLGDRGLRIRLMDDEATAAAERLGGYGVLQAVDGRGEKESMDGDGDDDDIDVATSGRADDAK